MSVDNIMQALQFGSPSASKTLTVLADGGFGNTLNMGQILKGKVLRHYEGSRYGVEFGGQERVVDSTVPLRTNEILYGRVVGLGDKVHLRQVSNVTLESNVDSQSKADGTMLHPAEQQLTELFARYNAKLTGNEKTNLIKMAAGSNSPQLMNLSGLILNKLGISLAPDLLRALSQHLQGRNRNVVVGEQKIIPEAIMQSRHNVELKPEHIYILAEGLQKYLQDENTKNFVSQQVWEKSLSSQDESRTYSGDSNSKDFNEQNQWLLGRCLLNTQQDGAVAHRYTTVPLWIGEKYVELNMAMYSQRESKGSELGHQRIVFSLVLDGLGPIDVSAIVTGRHISIDLAAERESAVEFLSSYMHSLKATLKEHEWQIDSIRYRVKTNSDEDAVLATVVEYQVSQDSLNNLI